MGYRSVASGRLHVSPITLLLELARLSKLVTPREIVKTDRFFPTRGRSQFLSPKKLNPHAISAPFLLHLGGTRSVNFLIFALSIQRGNNSTRSRDISPS